MYCDSGPVIGDAQCKGGIASSALYVSGTASLGTGGISVQATDTSQILAEAIATIRDELLLSGAYSPDVYATIFATGSGSTSGEASAQISLSL